MPIEGVLLDIDGTLIDSNHQNTLVWRDAMRANGIDVSYVKIREAVGMGGDNLLPAVAGVDKDSPQGKAIEAARAEMLAPLLAQFPPFPNAKALLTRMRQQGLTLIVATSAKTADAQTMLRHMGATDLIEALATSEDADQSKPAPDILGAALKKSGLSADRVLMLADTPHDIEAAQKAGVGIVCLRCGGWAAPDLAGARAVYDDPADLLAHYDDSLFAAR